MSALQTDWADEAEVRVLDAAITLAPTVGWNSRLVAHAGAAAGLPAGETMLLLPGGPRDLAALFSRRHDQAALVVLGELDPKALKMRERISRGVEARLDASASDGEALRRWAGYLALPPNLPLALKLVWESADGIWRWAGDRATDENHYSKRAILAAILISTLAIRLNAGREAASAHLATQIGRVMAYETWKAKIHPAALATQLATALGRLRYGR
jgi:ubiquinone biosynthesis protein COQ9